MAGGHQPGRRCREPRGRPRGRVRQAVLTGACARCCRVWPMCQRPVQRRRGCAPTSDKGPDRLVPPGVGDVPMRTYSGGPGGQGLSHPAAGRGQAPGERAAWTRRPASAVPTGVGRGREKPVSQDGDRPALTGLAGRPQTDDSLSSWAPLPRGLENKAPLSALASLPGPWAPPPGTEQSPHPGLPSHTSQAQAGPGGVCRGAQGALSSTWAAPGQPHLASLPRGTPRA